MKTLENDLVSLSAAKKPRLSKKKIRDRLFCIMSSNWTAVDWRVFSLINSKPTVYSWSMGKDCLEKKSEYFH